MKFQIKSSHFSCNYPIYEKSAKSEAKFIEQKRNRKWTTNYSTNFQTVQMSKICPRDILRTFKTTKISCKHI